MAKRQLFLDEYLIKRKLKPVSDSKIKILNWNVRNPSFKRALDQSEWLKDKDFNILILTEVKYSEGGIFLKDRLESFGFEVLFSEPKEEDLAALLAIRGFEFKRSNFKVNFLPHRVVSVILKTKIGKIELIGAYVPSRGFDIQKRREKKKLFVDSFLEALKTTPLQPYCTLCGDLNVLEPDHIPHYSEFEDWEYNFYWIMKEYQLKDAFRYLHPKIQEHSWFGKSGNGYRYDHCFISENLKKFVKECGYLHEPREIELSDHSAMLLEIEF